MGNYLSVGNYQFLKQHYFAQGSYGTVYQGRSKSNNHTKVAIKVLKPLAQQVTGSQYYDIIQQFRLLRQLQSTGIVQVYDWDIIRFTEKIRKFAIVMEMMDGTLRDLMVNYRKQNNGHQKIDQKMAKEWIKKIIKSYKSLYDQTINGQHIIHRDLKPENILYFKDANGEINFKLGDFGIARIQNYKNTLTHGKGAAWYISPQQANKKAGKYTTKTDVYSVGVIYFELLNKKERPPIQQQSINFLNRNRNFQLLQNKQDLLHQIKFENLKQQRQIQTKTKVQIFYNKQINKLKLER